MTFYELLLFVHIFSAILGMGPGFVMTNIATRATNMTELKHAYSIRSRLHTFVMVGGTLLLITGLWMGFIHPYLFTTGWFVVSLILYLIALAFGPFVLSPRSKPIKVLLKTHKGEDIPEEYDALAKKLFLYERIENGLFVIIIALMIWKPF
ncbi:DUF2269 domain-containing protein [Virgibacillus sp. NKC19-3]|uniref:DUF2269 family protein n=1 Tax=Virgibacillus saliphilus TaxID=2831674 RepID=UPI001C9B5092|nr:DUF2269 family protein [Virgibacillus sp. NKC19-3]MBY7142212.1 DUF2269 domain-containing protein [Virgibacillus sp. NKC19-3]